MSSDSPAPTTPGCRTSIGSELVKFLAWEFWYLSVQTIRFSHMIGSFFSLCVQSDILFNVLCMYKIVYYLVCTLRIATPRLNFVKVEVIWYLECPFNAVASVVYQKAARFRRNVFVMSCD